MAHPRRDPQEAPAAQAGLESSVCRETQACGGAKVAPETLDFLERLEPRAPQDQPGTGDRRAGRERAETRGRQETAGHQGTLASLVRHAAWTLGSCW